MRIVTFALLVAFVLPAWSSEPGQPLAFEDWESVDPSFPLTVAVRAGMCSEEPTLRCNANSTFGIDASGLHWAIQKVPMADQWGNPTTCGGLQMFRLELVRCQENLETCLLVAQLPSRCVFRPSGGTYCIDGAEPHAVWIDNTHGELFFRYESTEATPNCLHYARPHEVLRLSALPTLLELLQTYTPESGPISFRVPYMPEGFQYADYFDTYFGDLATVGNWGEAQPLQCGYPATAPSVGDYITVEDTLPMPAPNRGYYYVTAVNHQGQRRYGRQSNGGVLSGRDPGVLPECTE